MRRDNWPVGDEGIRPAGKPDECLYCKTKRGGQHKSDCVIRGRTVVLEMRVRYTTIVPESWTEEEILFHRNESSSCANNSIEELERIKDWRDEDAARGCWCSDTEHVFVREATEEDEERCGVRVVEEKT